MADIQSKDKKNPSLKGDPPCIWMQAGVVNKKVCHTNYACTDCRFDRVMKTVAHENTMLKKTGRAAGGKRGTIVLWKERLKSLPPMKRPCIHHMKDRIEFRACTNEYRCGSCDFDQYFHDQYSVHAVLNPINVLDVKGFHVPQGYYFHRGHTWAKIEEGATVRVGMDEFALRVMGPPDRIEAPLMGKEVKQGGACISVTRGDHRADLLSPVSGIVTAMNTRVGEQGSLANQDPYSAGWVMRVQSGSLRQDLKNLMINRETSDFMEEQIEELYHVIEETSGPLATDGGYLGNDIFGSMPAIGWDRLIKTFLHS